MLRFKIAYKNKHHSFCPHERNVSKKPFFLSITPDKSIEYAISTRLRPKLMTALGAIIALMPLALGIGAGAELHQPLAIAVIGGFLIAIPLLLIVLPTAIRWLYKNHESGEMD